MTFEAKYKPEYCQKATEILADGKSLARVCASLGICRETLTNWRNNYPEFSKAVKTGLQVAQANWEDIGEAGVKGEFEKFSAPSWIFTMKNRFRDDYKEDKEAPKSESTSLLESIIAGTITITKK